MPVPNHVKHKYGYDEAAYKDPLWETCTPDEIIDSDVADVAMFDHVGSNSRRLKSDGPIRNYMRERMKGNILFYRNAKVKLVKPRILRNTVGLVIPCSESEGFSLNPGIEITWQDETMQYFGPRGLFRNQYHTPDYVAGLPVSFVPPGVNKDHVGWSDFATMLVTAAARTNIDKIHAEADPICEKRRLESPALLIEYIKKHSGSSKVAEQLSQLIFSNGWHDKDPEALFAVLEFCKNNTDGIRNFSTWVRTHKAQIKLLDVETVKRAVVLANIMTVNKA